MTLTAIAMDTGPSRHDMLGIYLNDHLAGATAGSELAHRMARSHLGREESGPLNGLGRRDRAGPLGPAGHDGLARRLRARL